MRELGPLIENLLRKKKMWNQYKQNLIIEEWSFVVGEHIAAVTRAEKIFKGIIFVAVKDSTWAYHLTLLKPDLLQKINHHSGKKLVEDIYFRVGSVKQETVSGNICRESEEKTENQAETAACDKSLFLEQILKLKQL